ncbi:MAG: hypothetical protein EOP52_14150 [Sphingobacteriales bacterium]|nr:MAG: hypothetical protein EOP52_14150 [Sphingobacteriales bacterium]
MNENEHGKKAMVYSSDANESDQLSQDELVLLSYLNRHKSVIKDARFHERLRDHDPYGALVVAKASLDYGDHDALRFGAMLGWAHHHQTGRYNVS